MGDIPPRGVARYWETAGMPWDSRSDISGLHDPGAECASNRHEDQLLEMETGRAWGVARLLGNGTFAWRSARGDPGNKQQGGTQGTRGDPGLTLFLPAFLSRNPLARPTCTRGQGSWPFQTLPRLKKVEGSEGLVQWHRS